MTRSARAISPLAAFSGGDLTPNSGRKSPAWPIPSKGTKMGICFDCERKICICEKNSQDSISLCSEDDIQSNIRGQEADLSFISADGDIEDVGSEESPATQLLPPPPPEVGGQHAVTEEPTHLPPYRYGCTQEFKEGDRQVNVGDFRRITDNSTLADLSVFSVSSAEDVTIGAQKSVQCDTNVILNPESFSVLNLGIPNTAQFNFCPLGPDAKNTSLAVRACQIVGGPIYAGHRSSKRLRIQISNPGSFVPIFIPSGTMVGVMEVFHTRY